MYGKWFAPFKLVYKIYLYIYIYIYLFIDKRYNTEYFLITIQYRHTEKGSKYLKYYFTIIKGRKTMISPFFVMQCALHFLLKIVFLVKNRHKNKSN